MLPELDRTCDLVLIDEIGKMECFSSRFIEAVRGLLDGPSAALATVAIKGGGFIAEVKSRADVEMFEVTNANRDEFPQTLAESFQPST